jgi:hypothetical protein
LTRRGLGSTRLTTLIIIGTHVTILDQGTTQEGATVSFRLDADDLSRNGRLDTFRIEWPGYTAVGTLRQGNVVLGCSHEDD